MSKTMEIGIRRRYMSRIAEPVLTTSIWMSARNIFSAELVRLPLPQDLPYSPWYCIPGLVLLESPAHHLQKYLVNTDLMRSPSCSSPRSQGRSIFALQTGRPCQIRRTNESRWIKGCQAAQDL
jgi:hypothetical protein